MDTFTKRFVRAGILFTGLLFGWITIACATYAYAQGVKSVAPEGTTACILLESEDKQLSVERFTKGDVKDCPNAVVVSSIDERYGISCTSNRGRMTCGDTKVITEELPAGVRRCGKLVKPWQDLSWKNIKTFDVNVHAYLWSERAERCSKDVPVGIPYRHVKVGTAIARVCLQPGEACLSAQPGSMTLAGLRNLLADLTLDGLLDNPVGKPVKYILEKAIEQMEKMVK